LLRRNQVPLGLCTDGRWWALVWAPAEGATSVTVWDGGIWLEERETLQAFRCLLERRRFVGVPDDETLPALLEAGLEQQEEITESLGRQVRQAVEMLVDAISRAAQEGGQGGQLVAALDLQEIYHGAVTVMMRLLFLLFAEERLMLPADDELYLESYAAGHLVDRLREEANLNGEEALEHRTAAWQRLLALFRGVHRGITHDSLRIPAYGGAVFDPDRHPWLEGRRSDQSDAGIRALPIDDRTVLHALEAVQFVLLQGERRRLSFRTLDVEQIGYVYEGLLGYDAARAEETVLGLVGKLGEEPEVRLSELERVGQDASALADLMGLSSARIDRLMRAQDDLAIEQNLRAVTGGKEELIERLRPFAAIIRPDLRGVPVVIPSGGVYVTVSPRRRLSGTHYTPRDLAEKVVIGALEPLVYRPGPLETDDRSKWRRRSSDELLDLKIVDIAMGSGAFLVAASRYLAGEVIEAWTQEGDAKVRERPATAEFETGADADPVVVEARRQVIEHCLYGGDINPMAVEMAKLSLWLVSLSRERPFSFLDDRLVCGDSLLGLTSLEQLRSLHLDPQVAKRRAGERGLDIWGHVRNALDEVQRLRREINEREMVDLRDAAIKQGLLAEADRAARPLAVISDAMVGVAMAAAGTNRDAEAGFERVAQAAHQILGEADETRRGAMIDELANSAQYDLDTDKPQGAFDRRPTHWPLAFPEVFEGGGFDAVVGNPPFLGGQKLTGAFGTAYREFLVRWVAGEVRGSADLLAYFLLVASRLLDKRGQTGLIGTNTIAQGDTREVGLDQILASGESIRAAVKSATWPTKTVNLEYSIVWATPWVLGEGVGRYLANERVPYITSSLDASDGDLGQPSKLTANQGISFQGTTVLGMGFILTPEGAEALIEKDPRNADVLFPYINGEDLNSRPDFSGSRWVINFFDWPLERAEEYRDCLEIVRRLVKPERDQNRRANYRTYWWRYGEHRPGLYKAIDRMDRVLAITQTSRLQLPTFLPTGMVYAHKLVIFAWNSPAALALISSEIHRSWVVARGSTMRTDPVYTPSDVFETFPLPDMTAALDSAGEQLNAHRGAIMLQRQLGLTKLYNLVHSNADASEDIARLRDIHREIDQATAEAYGWGDIRLDHGFHETSLGTRCTISAAARGEILQRLLQLNHQRHAEEEAAGVAAKRSGRAKGRGPDQMTLIES
jgi:hypothetical protein